MKTINVNLGSTGKAVFGGRVTGGDNSSTSNMFSIDTESMVQFFRQFAVLKSNITLNALGLYSIGKMGRRRQIKFASLSSAKHLLKPNNGGCVWDPSKGINMNGSVFETQPYEYQGEQCPDTFLETCFEGIYGTGVNVKDLMRTKEGRALMKDVIRIINEGLGNDFYDVVTWTGHELIDVSDDRDLYSSVTDDDEWAAFKKKLSASRFGGHMTVVDRLKARGHDQYNVEFEAGEINEFGEFIGDPTVAFDRIIANQNREMKASARKGVKGVGKAILCVTEDIFNSYKRHLINEFGSSGIPAPFYLMITGKWAEIANSLDTPYQADGVLMYDGYPVVCMDEWEAFNEITNTKTSRILAVTPGNFGVGFDVDDLKQFKGMGLRMIQRLEDPWGGKIFMSTNLDIGAGLVNENYCVNMSHTMIPSV